MPPYRKIQKTARAPPPSGPAVRQVAGKGRSPHSAHFTRMLLAFSLVKKASFRVMNPEKDCKCCSVANLVDWETGPAPRDQEGPLQVPQLARRRRNGEFEKVQLPKIDQIGIPGITGGHENWGSIFFDEAELLLEAQAQAAGAYPLAWSPSRG